MKILHKTKITVYAETLELACKEAKDEAYTFSMRGPDNNWGMKLFNQTKETLFTLQSLSFTVTPYESARPCFTFDVTYLGIE